MKEAYEISLWEDYLVGTGSSAYYDERRIGVIGSDTLTAAWKAFDPHLTSNVNGTHKFSFKMLYNVLEPGQEPYQNPFLGYLVNERKVKVFWKDEWYDFIIKSCKEDSSGKIITYECIDLFINELSKSGFELEFSGELENNQGTVQELGTKVLAGTDWQVNSGDIIRQEKEEPVYEATVPENRGASVFTNETTGETRQLIPGNSLVLIYYDQIRELVTSTATSGTSYFQFAYAPIYTTDTGTQLVNNANCYSFTTHWTRNDTTHIISLGYGDPWVEFNYDIGVSNRYRATRLVRRIQSVLDPVTDKSVEIYKLNSDTIYKYQETQYESPLLIHNLITDGKGFTSVSSWHRSDGEPISLELYPPISTTSDTWDRKAHLVINKTTKYYNGGLWASNNYLANGCAIGEKYIFRYKARTVGGSAVATGVLYPKICQYEIDAQGRYVEKTNGVSYFGTPQAMGSSGDVNGWRTYLLTCTTPFTRKEILSNNIAVFCEGKDNNGWLEEVQLFKYVQCETTDAHPEPFLTPDNLSTTGLVTTHYKYYNKTAQESVTDPTNLVYLWDDVEDWTGSGAPTPVYNENFVKIRSIEAKQSNRFNLLQTLAETFECWAIFSIEHESNGKIKLNNTTHKPYKSVTFVKEIGQQTGIGFEYGIDLKSITRTIDSNQIVTKTIVLDNNNQYAQNGMCSIARSPLNFSRSNFILNFDYYITHGLLDATSLNNDLYNPASGYIGYYSQLHQLNIEYDARATQLASYKTELTRREAEQTMNQSSVQSTAAELDNLKSKMMQLYNKTTWAAAKAAHAQASTKSEKAIGYDKSISQAEQNLAVYQQLVSSNATAINNINSLISSLTTQQESTIDALEALTTQFYNKYARFIQEGSWTSADYIDDNLYYLDAQSVAYTSSRPKVTYDISVMRVSALEEYKEKVFHLGDIAYVQDVEFFGYVYVNNLRTPYKEQVVVTEIESYFDTPSKDTIKVQNYKTQFEDLFQRITATTQSLQYSTGEYAKAAALVTPDGTIKPQAIQDAIAYNNNLVWSAQNELVTQDATGITVRDGDNPRNQMRLTSGGLFLTTDQGATWKNALSAGGLTADFITGGTIQANKVTIMDGINTAFRWDETGLNAYNIYQDDTTVTNVGDFVRFDHFGLYGMSSVDDAVNFKPTSEEEIWQNANYGLTWRGFFLKNGLADERIEISTDNDIAIFKTPTDSEEILRIKIGRLGLGDTSWYGFLINDANGNPILRTEQDGSLWLRQELHISHTAQQGDTDYNIRLGYLPIPAASTETLHQVFNASDSFIVYEDGSIKALNGQFEGEITATSGQIGPLVIEDGLLALTDGTNTMLSFTADGLIINGSAFTITNGSDNTFYVNSEGQIVANNIKVESGEFTGILNAQSGIIGGFQIENGLLNSVYTENGVPTIILNGAEGTITANYITLGTGAKIADYIRLGEDCYLRSPNGDNHAVLEAHGIRILDSGVIMLSDDDNDNTIKISAENGGTIFSPGFTLTSDWCTFNNVAVSGKITSSVFEVGTVQSVGGAMAFAEAYRVISVEAGTSENTYILTLDGVYTQQSTDDTPPIQYIYLVEQNGTLSSQPYAVTFGTAGESTSTIQISSTDSINPRSILVVGTSGSHLFTINSTDTASAITVPRALALNEFKYVNNTASFDTHLLLGDLHDITGVNNYGLYCDNVILRGALTTTVGSGDTRTYAGVSSYSDAQDTENHSIVFWAGAASAEDVDIQSAPFIVTNTGTLYAYDGHFKGGVYSDGILEAVDIYAAKIHGYTQNKDSSGIPIPFNHQTYGLSIFGGAASSSGYSGGIAFYSGYDGVDELTGLSPHLMFVIDSQGLRNAIGNDEADSPIYYIQIDEDGAATFTGKAINVDEYYTAPHGGARLYLGGSDNVLSNCLSLRTNEQILSTIEFNTGSAIDVKIGDDAVALFISDGFKVNKNVQYGEQMTYKKNGDGYYDLYVI